MVPLHSVKVRWLTAEEGGRTSPFMGVHYTPTARFAGEQDQFSVVVDFAQDIAANATKGTLRLLKPDLVEIQQRIRPGAALEIMEGSRVVARCVVENSEVSAVIAAAT